MMRVETYYSRKLNTLSRDDNGGARGADARTGMAGLRSYPGA